MYAAFHLSSFLENPFACLLEWHICHINDHMPYSRQVSEYGNQQR